MAKKRQKTSVKKKAARKAGRKKGYLGGAVKRAPMPYGERGANGEPPLTDEGLDNAARFFDEVDENEGLQAAIGLNNQNVIQLAQQMGFKFNYPEMSAHLRARWDIRRGPDGHYCCT
jgi:hypothetical protein